jgi:hypothetical protein
MVRSGPGLALTQTSYSFLNAQANVLIACKEGGPNAKMLLENTANVAIRRRLFNENSNLAKLIN